MGRSKWKADVSVRLGSGARKMMFLGRSVTEEQAAERVSAGAYILGDRCARKVPCVDVCAQQACLIL